MDVHSQRSSGRAVWPWLAVALALATVAWWLFRAYRLAPYSDPGLWYACGRDFTETFAHSKRAFGFPLLLNLALRMAGDYPAFLVNLPILLLLGLALALFARRLAGASVGDASRATFLCGAALFLFVAVNDRMLPYLVNPYRDPLSFLLMVTSALLLVRFRQDPARHPWDPAWAGAALAYAMCTRETSVLLLPVLFAYALLARRNQRDLPFARPLLLFLAAFAVVAVPFAMQNYLVTGNPVLPAQATKSQTFKGHLIPGVQLDFLGRTLPACLHLLRAHYGVGTIGLAALAVVCAGFRRGWREPVFGLLLPAIALYLLFYGSYVYPVERYLFVLDLFVVPLAALGVAALGDGLAGLAAPRLSPARLLSGIGIALCLATAALAGYRATREPPHFNLADMRRLATEVTGAMPADAVLVGDRPLGEFFRSFGLRQARVIDFLTPQVSIRHPGVGPSLDALHRQSPSLYFLNRRALARRVALREFDLAEERRFDADRFHLRPLLESSAFTLERIVPWTERHIACRAPVPHGGGATLLEVRTGRLSKWPRSYARLWAGDQLVSEHLPDYDSFFLVQLQPGTTELDVRLESDQPLASILDVRAQRADTRLALEFAGDAVLEHPTRLSDSFFTRPRMATDPFITADGALVLPTPTPAGECFLFCLDGRTALTSGDGPLPATLALPGIPPVTREWPGTGESRRLYLAAPAGAITQDETRIELRIGNENSRATYLLESASVSRARQAASLHIVLGEDADEPFLVYGFHRAERGDPPGRLTWRWTAPRAALWLPLAPDPRPVRLIVRCRDAVPSAYKAGAPRFRLNDRLLASTHEPARDPASKLLEFVFDIPAADWPDDAPVLEIEANGWVPAERGNSRDHRRLGIMLLDVEARRS